MRYTSFLPLSSSEFSAPKLCWRLRSVGLAQSVAYGLSPCSLKPKNLDLTSLKSEQPANLLTCYPANLLS
ncbi:MAG: hypothetical protein F6K50_21430 [Moorea sp. SIO3I7]|uniref:hypothetical protein n=1 Tax=Moorena sp. SIO3I8 TaxID=2607833 RepID=UPI0013C18E13|nr:hypothetical protein [Moorena sp. SIO3I8]NEN97984.1 hypothetical protein [Moorena sp. SIO3I7]NEO05490.1 hypothetical protein [Moorena sp. SIO3I8]